MRFRTELYLQASIFPFRDRSRQTNECKNAHGFRPVLDPVDNAVWSYTAEEAMFEGLRGHKGDVEYLISCGLLRPAAKVLENGADEQSKAS